MYIITYFHTPNTVDLLLLHIVLENQTNTQNLTLTTEQ